MTQICLAFSEKQTKRDKEKVNSEKAVTVAKGNLTPSALSYTPFPVLILFSLHCEKLSISVPSRRLYATGGKGLFIWTGLCLLKIHMMDP